MPHRPCRGALARRSHSSPIHTWSITPFRTTYQFLLVSTHGTLCTDRPPSHLPQRRAAHSTSFFPCSCSRALRLCAILSACARAATASKVLFVSSASSASPDPSCIASSPSTVLPSSQSESKAKLSSALDADCRPSSRSLIGSSSTMELVLDGPGSQFNVSGNRSNFPRPPR